jgi:hypothetical protein
MGQHVGGQGTYITHFIIISELSDINAFENLLPAGEASE